jgi:DNA helicase-4
MNGRGKPAVAHKVTPRKVLLTDLNTFEPNSIEREQHPGDIITPAVLRLTSKALNEDLDVVILCRRNKIPWFVNDHNGQSLGRYLDIVRSFFPKGLKERITISTAHKYKGLEKSMVIILDADLRSYPLIHPTWEFFRVLGDSPEKIIEEERRLFYVALTRAVEKLVIITDGRSKSPFLEEMERRHKFDSINWSEYPPIRRAITRLVVKVGNHEQRGGEPTFIIKDLLKASQYKYQQQGKDGAEWVKSFLAKGFSIETLQAELWAASADGVVVRIYDDTEVLIARYHINSGQWSCVYFDQKQTSCTNE